MAASLSPAPVFGTEAVGEQGKPRRARAVATLEGSICDSEIERDIAPVTLASNAQGPVLLRVAPQGLWKIGLEAPGHAPLETRVLVGPYDEVIDLHALQSAPAEATPGASPPATATAKSSRERAVLTGAVVDQEGQPISSALVWLSSVPACYTISDTAGSFRLSLPPSTSLADATLQAVAAGFSQEAFAPQGAGRGPLRFRLRPAATLRGRIVDRAGRAIESATVKARAFGRSTLTSSEGAFVLAGLPTPAEALVEIAAPGYAPVDLRVRLSDNPILEAGVATLDKLRLLKGRLTGRPGQPLENLWVSAQGRTGSRHEGRVKADGTFELGPVAPGGWHISVSVRGQTLRTLDVDVPATEGAFLLAAIDLRGDRQLRGIVFDAKRREVEGAQVFLRPRGSAVRRTGAGAPRVQPEAVTGPDGRFEIDGLDSTGDFELEVWKDGFLPARKALPPRDSSEDLVLTLEAATRIEGLVISESGTPIAGASVSARSPERRPDTPTSRAFLQTDREGRFVLPSQEPGRQSISVLAEGFATEHQEISIAEGEVRRELRLTLRPEAILTGRVVDEQGNPVALASIAVPSSLPQAFPVGDTTSADGSFVLYNLPSGRLKLAASHKDFKEAVVEVDLMVGRQESQIVLERLGQHTVSGHLLDPEGRPLGGARVRLWSGGVNYEAVTDARGAFTLQCPEGPGILSVAGFRLPPEEARIELDRNVLGLILHPLPL